MLISLFEVQLQLVESQSKWTEEAIARVERVGHVVVPVVLVDHVRHHPVVVQDLQRLAKRNARASELCEPRAMHSTTRL
jgi:hypothetical protein